MERLTIDTKILFCDIAQCRETPGGSFCEDGYCDQRRVYERLREYERLGDIDDLTALVKARDEGRVKIGDTVYTSKSWCGDYERSKDRPYAHTVVFIGINGETDFFNTKNEKTERMFSFNFTDIGKTVFLTRAEAEAALGGGVSAT